LEDFRFICDVLYKCFTPCAITITEHITEVINNSHSVGIPLDLVSTEDFPSDAQLAAGNVLD